MSAFYFSSKICEVSEKGFEFCMLLLSGKQESRGGIILLLCSFFLVPRLSCFCFLRRLLPQDFFFQFHYFGKFFQNSGSPQKVASFD